MFQLSDYNYTLPQHLIAQELASPPDSAKLLVYERSSGTISDYTFHELPGLLPEGSQLFFNTSKVVKARIPVLEGKGEIFFLETTEDDYTFEALVRPGKKMKVGSTIAVGEYLFEIIGMTEQGRVIKSSHPILDILEQIGQMPLPPYIGYDESKSDNYQPLQAKHPGSVAAPTASLHFTEQTFTELSSKGCGIHEVILHIGLGTFKQVDTESIKEYAIHSEKGGVTMHIFESITDLKVKNQPLVAVGTTVTRTLESLPYLRTLFTESVKGLTTEDTQKFWNGLTEGVTTEQAEGFIGDRTVRGTGRVGAISEDGFFPVNGSSAQVLFDSKLYIYPGFNYLLVDHLVTNFHLPKSSLLMLVAGFVGYEKMMEIYQYAIEHEYQFYSFGDGMLIL